MNLSGLKEFLELNSGASLLEIARYFNSDVNGMQLILNHWVGKGRLEQGVCSISCGDCASCPLQNTKVYYYWVKVN